MKTYSATLDFLYTQLPMYQRDGATAIKKDLTNTIRLCAAIGDPQHVYPSIHIAGTNGKGTVSHLLAAVLQEAGYKVGLYTSPHYRDFRERIKVNGIYISENQVVSFVHEQLPIINEIKPSFFEITVAMAFDHFRNEEVEIAVIETGLGGRLDSTNIIDPILSVITHISLDHQALLGPDIYSIAKEKAGIIKPKRPVVIGRYQPSCDSVFNEKARAITTKPSYASLYWSHQKVRDLDIFKRKKSGEMYQLTLPVESPFITENVITALEAIHTLRQSRLWNINASDIELGIEQFVELSNYIGRWQVLGEHPMIVADSAHNEDAIEKVIKKLVKEDWKKIHFVIGFVNDKDLAKFLPLFPQTASYYFVKPNIPRGLDATILKNAAEDLGLIGLAYESVQAGISAAKATALEQDLIYIGGSSFVVAEAI